MVQTKKGAGDNPWISYMRACAANYKPGVAQSKPKNPAKPKTSTKAKPAKPMTEKDMQTLHKVVNKANGKAKAKEKAKDDKKK